MSEWSEIRVIDDEAAETYSMAIFDNAGPYAVVHSAGRNRYAVALATSNDDARRLAFQAHENGEYGIRIYYRAGFWFGQVHYFGGKGEEPRDWKCHAQCLKTAERERTRLDLGLR